MRLSAFLLISLVFHSCLALKFVAPDHSDQVSESTPSPLFLFDDYSVSISCNADQYLNDEDKEAALDRINLRWIDSIVFISLGSVTFLSTLFIILTFIRYKEARGPPGDLILGISIAEFVLTIHWMVSASRFLSNPDEPPKSNGSFCRTNAVISIIAGTYEFLYNCSFCIFVTWKIKSVLKGGTLRRDVFHIICFLICLCLMIGLVFEEDLGKNLFGTCSVKAISKFPLIGPLLLVIYVIVAFATIYYFKKNVPNDERFKELKEGFLNYYYKYVKACSIIWSVLAVCNIAAVANCFSSHGGISWLNVFLTLGNICKLFTPLVLSFLRYQDPFLKKKVNRFCRRIKHWVVRKNTSVISQNFIPEEEKNKDNQEDNEKVGDQQLEFVINKPMDKSPFDSDSLNDENDIWLNTLRNDMKVQLTYTMLSGILLNYQNVKGALKLSKTLEHQNFGNTVKYGISNESLRQFLPKAMDLLESLSFNALPMSMTVYAPAAFEDLIEHDRDMIDLEVSLDLERNFEQIQKASGADGGKGGEFFFFSYDNRIILKTLTHTDLTQLRAILKDYYRYFEKHKDSMIAKIYGVYTFDRKDVKDQSTTIMLMRNIAAVPKKYILRSYDLKGSTFDREVLKNKPDAELNKLTLKDIDFTKIEKKIFIEEKVKKVLHKILEKDSEFFRERKLIDYSLIVFKIDKRRYFEDMEKEGQKPAEFVLNKRELLSLKNVYEDGIYYHMGIIDYLQPYNLQKYVEKISKKVMNANLGLNTSAQDPKTYHDRFCKFMKQII